MHTLGSPSVFRMEIRYTRWLWMHLNSYIHILLIHENVKGYGQKSICFLNQHELSADVFQPCDRETVLFDLDVPVASSQPGTDGMWGLVSVLYINVLWVFCSNLDK